MDLCFRQTAGLNGCKTRRDRISVLTTRAHALVSSRVRMGHVDRPTLPHTATSHLAQAPGLILTPQSDYDSLVDMRFRLVPD